MRNLSRPGERDRSGIEVLARASRLLATWDGDVELLTDIARLPLPDLADGCLIDLVAHDTHAGQSIVAHVDPDREWLLGELRRQYPAEPTGDDPLGLALRAGRAVDSADATDAWLRWASADPRRAALIDQLQARSIICAPLTAARQVFGAITLLAARPSDPTAVSTADALAGTLAGMLAASRSAHHAAELRERLDSLTAAARDLAHQIGNTLTLPIGTLELVGMRADVPDDLREILDAASTDLEALEQHVHAFRDQVIKHQRAG